MLISEQHMLFCLKQKETDKKHMLFSLRQPGRVKVDFEAARKWDHLRRSNTEPVIRIYSEAPTVAEAEALAREVTYLANRMIAQQG